MWLKAAGYHTGLYGKYINGYGAGAPYIPPGWDEWHAFKNVAYFNYTLVENGVEVAYGSADTDYSTDVLRDLAVQFIHDSRRATSRSSSTSRRRRRTRPATPAPRHAGMFSGIPPWRPPNYNEADVSDKPAWVQAIAPWDPNKQANHDTFDRKQLESPAGRRRGRRGAHPGAHATSASSTTRSSSSPPTTATRGARTAGSRSSARTRSACACRSSIRYTPLAPLPRVETGFGLNIDHGVTLAELAGATPDPGVEGVSMVRLLDGTAPSWRTDFLEEHWDGTPGDETDVGSIPTYAEVRGTAVEVQRAT